MTKNKRDKLRSFLNQIITSNITNRLFVMSVKNTGLTATIIPVEIEGREYSVDILKQSIMVNKDNLLDDLDHYKNVKQILSKSFAYLNKQTSPAWNTLERATETVNFLNEVFTDISNDNLYCVTDIDDDSDVRSMGIESFCEAASIYLDILRWDGSDANGAFAISQKIEDNFAIKSTRIKNIAGITRYMDINKSVLSTLNYDIKETLNKASESAMDAYGHTVNHIKQRMSVVKSKYTKNKQDVPSEIKDSFEINGLICNWSLSHYNYELSVSFSFKDDTLDRIIKERGLEGTRNKILFFIGTKSKAKCIKLLLKRPLSSSSIHADTISALYALSFASGSKNEFDIDGMKDVIGKIFTAIREQIDYLAAMFLDNLGGKKITPIKKNKINNAAIARTMASFSERIIAHTEIHGDTEEIYGSSYSHKFLLPENYIVGGNRMYVCDLLQYNLLR